MTTIIIILLAIAIFSFISAFVVDDNEAAKVYIVIWTVLIIVFVILFTYNHFFNIQAEDYINNPSAYQLDTIGTHINVTKVRNH